MKLRKLELMDAPLMLEWMHEDNVIHFMGTDFSRKTMADCEAFIRSSQTDEHNIHRAIVNDKNVYMGTVSLKNIDRNKNNAEFAITVRTEAMGKGYSKFGMGEIIRYGFEEVGLDSIYWYVNKENNRAIRFYDKNGYHEDKSEGRDTAISTAYKWYVIQRAEVLSGDLGRGKYHQF